MFTRFLIATSLALVPTLLPGVARAESAAATPAPAQGEAGPSSTLQLVWQVYLGGFNLGNIGLKTSFSGNGYSAVSRLKTAGVVNSFYEAVIDASTVGLVAGQSLQPTKYNSNTVNEKMSQKVDLTYSAAGIDLFAEPAYNTDRYPVSLEQKRGTLDPLSGIVYALSGVSRSSAKPCGDTVRVFDGRRRYDIDLKFQGQDKLRSDEGYSGAAMRCTITYRQIAGFKPNINRGRALPTITVWFANLESTTGGPIQAFHVPVKIMTETPYGLALAHARKITVDGTAKSN
jgi:hypothetical protein